MSLDTLHNQLINIDQTYEDHAERGESPMAFLSRIMAVDKTANTTVSIDIFKTRVTQLKGEEVKREQVLEVVGNIEKAVSSYVGLDYFNPMSLGFYLDATKPSQILKEVQKSSESEDVSEVTRRISKDYFATLPIVAKTTANFETKQVQATRALKGTDTLAPRTLDILYTPKVKYNLTKRGFEELGLVLLIPDSPHTNKTLKEIKVGSVEFCAIRELIVNKIKPDNHVLVHSSKVKTKDNGDGTHEVSFNISGITDKRKSCTLTPTAKGHSMLVVDDFLRNPIDNSYIKMVLCIN